MSMLEDDGPIKPAPWWVLNSVTAVCTTCVLYRHKAHFDLSKAPKGQLEAKCPAPRGIYRFRSREKTVCDGVCDENAVSPETSQIRECSPIPRRHGLPSQAELTTSKIDAGKSIKRDTCHIDADTTARKLAMFLDDPKVGCVAREARVHRYRDLLLRLAELEKEDRDAKV